MRVVAICLNALGLIALTSSPACSQRLFLDRSIPTPANLTEGLAWDGAALWNCDRGSDRFYQIDPADGTILNSFASPIDNPVGLAWRPESGTIWLGTSGITREVDTSGAVLKTIFESTFWTSLGWKRLIHGLWRANDHAPRRRRHGAEFFSCASTGARLNLGWKLTLGRFVFHRFAI